MEYILYYYFLDDLIASLDEKYKGQISEIRDKEFLYSYLFEIPKYYRLFSFKNKNPYHLYEKLHQEKIADVIMLLADQIRENNYQKDAVLMLYAYVSGLIFNAFLNTYTKSILNASLKLPITKWHIQKKYYKIQNMITSQFYYEREKQKITKLKPYKKYLKKRDTLGEQITIINSIFSKIYFFSYGGLVYKKCFKNYLFSIKHFTNDPLGIKKFFLTISTFFSYGQPLLPSRCNFGLGKTFLKKDYLNYKKKKWALSNQSFNEAYHELVSSLSTVLTKIAEELYYRKGIKKDSISAILELKNKYMSWE